MPKGPQNPALSDQRLSSSVIHAQLGEPSGNSSIKAGKGDVDSVSINKAPQRDMERIPKKGRPRKAVHVQSSDPGISLDMKKRMDKWRPRKAVPAQSSARKLALAEVREIEGAANALVKLSKEAWGYGKGDPSIKPKVHPTMTRSCSIRSAFICSRQLLLRSLSIVPSLLLSLKKIMTSMSALAFGQGTKNRFSMNIGIGITQKGAFPVLYFSSRG